jgi:hypothetical protein
MRPTCHSEDHEESPIVIKKEILRYALDDKVLNRSFAPEVSGQVTLWMTKDALDDKNSDTGDVLRMEGAFARLTSPLPPPKGDMEQCSGKAILQLIK